MMMMMIATVTVVASASQAKAVLPEEEGAGEEDVAKGVAKGQGVVRPREGSDSRNG